MKIASIAEIKSQFSSFLKASETDPVLVTRNGRPVAVIMGIQDEDDIERLVMAHSSEMRAVLEKSREQIRKGDVLSHAEFWDAVAAARAGRRSRKRKVGRTAQ